MKQRCSSNYCPVPVVLWLLEDHLFKKTNKKQPELHNNKKKYQTIGYTQCHSKIKCRLSGNMENKN